MFWAASISEKTFCRNPPNTLKLEDNLRTEQRSQVCSHLGGVVGAAVALAGEELAPQQLLPPRRRRQERLAVRDGQLLPLHDVSLR